MSEENENTPDDQIKSIYGEEADILMPDLLVPQVEESELVNEMKDIKDRMDGSFKFCFIGAGQGGCRIAESFHKLGYGRVAAVNTAQQDLNTIKLENKLCIGKGGSGKDPDTGEAIIEERREDVLDFMRYSFGKTFDRIMVCAGAGGGSGTGMLLPLIDIAKEVQALHQTIDQKVGVILTLPKISEGNKVNHNAFKLMKKLFPLVLRKVVSPLIILDNEKMSKLHPNVPVSKFWDVANSNLAGLFHLFNLTSSKDSSYTAFDKNDYKGILDSGLIVFGASPVSNWKDPVEISRVVRENLKGNLLSGGIDISTGKTAGVIMIGGPEILDTLPQGYIDQSLDQLNRILRRGSTVHGGVYSGDKPSLNVFSVVGGMDEPHERLNELLMAAH